MGIESEDALESHQVPIGKNLNREVKIVSGKNPELEEGFPHSNLEELGRNLAEARAEAYRDKTILEHTKECKRDILEALKNGTLTAAILDDEVVSVGSIHPLGSEKNRVTTIHGKPIYMIGRASTLSWMKGNGLYKAVTDQMMERFNRFHDPYETPLMSSAHNNALSFRRKLKDWKEIDKDNMPDVFPADLVNGLRKDIEDGEVFFIYDPKHLYYPEKE